MIPKMIHYCWFGEKPLPILSHKCIDSWKEFMPNFQIKLWDENNSPMEIAWVKDAYKNKAYAFVSDYVRLYAIYKFGGIYLDTDVLVIKPLNNFLNLKCFFGFEDENYVNAAIIGAEPNLNVFKELINLYDGTKFSLTNSNSIPKVISVYFKKIYPLKRGNKNQFFEDICFFKPEYFYPIHYSQINLFNKEQFVTNNTYTIHLWNYSWRDEFWYLENKKFFRGFFLVVKRIIKNPKLPFVYYRKVLRYLSQILIGEKNTRKIKYFFLTR